MNLLRDTALQIVLLLLVTVMSHVNNVNLTFRLNDHLHNKLLDHTNCSSVSGNNAVKCYG